MQKIDVKTLLEKLIPATAPESVELQRFFIDLVRDIAGLLEDADLHSFNFNEWEKSTLSRDKNKLLNILTSIKDEGKLKDWYVPAYLASLAHTLGTQNESLAYKWASANAYIILQLVNKHEPNIKMLCLRFRLAHSIESKHIWLWKKLPTLPNSTSNIISKLKTLEKEYKTAEDELNKTTEKESRQKISSIECSERIAEIRRPYEIKAKMNRSRQKKEPCERKTAVPTKTPIQIQDSFTQEEPIRIPFYLDEETLQIDEIVFQKLDPIKGVSYLEQLNDNQTETIVDTNSDAEPGMEHSANMQDSALKQQIAHIQRNLFEFPTNPKVLTLPQIQLVFKALWQSFNQQTTYAKHKRNQLYVEFISRQIIDTCLLMSLLTGSPAVIWLDFPRILTLGEVIFDKKRNNQLFWYPKLDITEFSVKVDNHPVSGITKNKYMSFATPLPNQACEILSNHGLSEDQIPNEAMLRSRISEIRNELGLPILSLDRIKSALHGYLRRYANDHYVADLMCSISPRHSPGIFYGSYELSQIEESYRNTIHQFAHKTDTFNGVYLKQKFELESCGSQIAPTHKLVIAFFDQLSQSLKSQTDHVQQFNVYAIWMWHIFMLLTSCRPVNHMPGKLTQIDRQAKLIWFSDKEMRVTSSSGRMIPLCQHLENALNDYLEYLKKYARKYGATDVDTYLMLQKTLDSERPLLNIKHDGNWKAITPELVLNYVRDILPFPLNWTRHYGRSYLYEKQLDIHLIDALCGHEAPAHEALHPYSAMSLHDLKTAATFYDQMANDLQLKRVVIHVA